MWFSIDKLIGLIEEILARNITLDKFYDGGLARPPKPNYEAPRQLATEAATEYTGTSRTFLTAGRCQDLQ